MYQHLCITVFFLNRKTVSSSRRSVAKSRRKVAVRSLTVCRLLRTSRRPVAGRSPTKCKTPAESTVTGRRLNGDWSAIISVEKKFHWSQRSQGSCKQNHGRGEVAPWSQALWDRGSRQILVFCYLHLILNHCDNYEHPQSKSEGGARYSLNRLAGGQKNRRNRLLYTLPFYENIENFLQ